MKITLDNRSRKNALYVLIAEKGHHTYCLAQSYTITTVNGFIRQGFFDRKLLKYYNYVYLLRIPQFYPDCKIEWVGGTQDAN